MTLKRPGGSMASPAGLPAEAPACGKMHLPVRVLVHDFSGHPFQVQLSRVLAARGHEVLHLYCSEYQTGKGAVAGIDSDPQAFHVESVSMTKPWDRYSWLRRVRQERQYGAAFARRAERFEPDVVLAC